MLLHDRIVLVPYGAKLSNIKATTEWKGGKEGDTFVYLYNCIITFESEDCLTMGPRVLLLLGVLVAPVAADEAQTLTDVCFNDCRCDSAYRASRVKKTNHLFIMLFAS